MIYEIPISKEKYAEMQSKEWDKDMTVLFRSTMEDMVDILFVFCHGNKDGLMNIKGHLLTPEKVLAGLINGPANIKQKGITSVYTICCYGGLQLQSQIDGITISSLHSSKEQIYAKAQQLVDGDCFLEVITD